MTTAPATEHSLLASQATSLITDALLSNGFGKVGYATKRLEEIAAAAQSYSDTTLRKIISLSSNKEEFSIHCSLIADVVHPFGHEEDFVSNYLHLLHCFPFKEEENRLATVALALASLHSYEGLAKIGPNFEYSQERIDQCTAILSLLEIFEDMYSTRLTENYPMEVESFNDDGPYGHLGYVISETSSAWVRILEEEALVHLITNPDTDLKALLAVVEERSLTEADEIIPMMEARKGIHHVIGSGVL